MGPLLKMVKLVLGLPSLAQMVSKTPGLTTQPALAPSSIKIKIVKVAIGAALTKYEWKMTCDDSSALELETFSRNGGGSSPDASKLFLFPGVSDATATNGSADGPGSSAFNCNPVGVAVAIVPALVGFVAIF